MWVFMGAARASNEREIPGAFCANRALELCTMLYDTPNFGDYGCN